MTKQSLLKLIHAVPLERKVISSGGRFYTCQELLESVAKFRAKNQELEGKNVAIKLSDSFEFIKSIIALDSWAKSILILPFSTGDKVVDELVLEAQSQYLLKSSGIKALKESSESQDTVNTSWILATSGTTGRPKLIRHSLDSLTRSVVRNIEKGAEFKWGLFYDPARFAGLQVVLQSLISGSLLVTASQDDFEAQLSAASKEKINALSATPSLWRKLLMARQAREIPLTLVTLGGEISDQATLNQLKKYYPNAKIRHIYASTEAGVGFAVSDGFAGFPSDWLNSDQSVVEMKVYDGRLFIKPSILPAGDEIEKRIDSKGFLDSGDCVEIIENRVIFKGRDSGVINVGGNKVQPEEIEEVIRQLPSVSDVRVFGKKNPVLGQLVCADIVKASLDSDSKQVKNEIVNYCKCKIDKYKIPVLIKFVDDIPVSIAGKVIRN